MQGEVPTKKLVSSLTLIQDMTLYIHPPSTPVFFKLWCVGAPSGPLGTARKQPFNYCDVSWKLTYQRIVF